MRCSRGAFASRRCSRARVDRPLRRSRRRRLRRIQQARRSRPATSPGRTRATPSASTTAGLPSPRSPRSRCRATCTTPSGLAELAREVWRDPSPAERLDREADELQRRFDEAFWVDERGGFYALALDGKKRPVDARCSNMGHLLWSGISASRASPIDGRPAPLGRALVRLGDSHHGERRGVCTTRSATTTDGLAARLGARRLGPGSSRLRGRGSSHRAGPRLRAAAHFDWSLPEVFAATPGTRLRSRSHTPRLRARRPGRRHADPPGPRSFSRNRARSHAAAAHLDRDGRAPELARRSPHRRSACVRPHADRCRRARSCNDCRRRMRVGLVCPVWFLFLRRRMAGPSASSRSSRRVSSTPTTTSLSSRRATRRHARAQSPSSTRPRASGSGTRTGRCSTLLHAFRKGDEFDVVHDHTGMLACVRWADPYSVLPHGLLRTARRPAGAGCTSRCWTWLRTPS